MLNTLTSCWHRHTLANTGPGFLAGEFVGSLVLGFMGPDWVLPEQPDPLTCENSWCATTAFDEGLHRVLLAGNPRAAATASHVFTLATSEQGAGPRRGVPEDPQYRSTFRRR